MLRNAMRLLIRPLFRPITRALPFIFLLLRTALALEITVLDVGQGTSVLIQAPTGQTALYDAGTPTSNTIRHLQQLGVTTLSLAIASHGHADHIGGMPDVLTTYAPQFYMDNGIPHTTLTYERTLQAALASGVQLLEPTRRNINLGDVQLTIIPPPGDPHLGHNDNSIGLRITYGNFSAFLPGDAEETEWAWWLTNHPDLLTPVNVHVASHHGSRNGDTPAGIHSLNPEVVVISSGTNNTYGHPHAEALRIYNTVNATIVRTDENGHIRIKADPNGTFTMNSLTPAPGSTTSTPPPAQNTPQHVSTSSCVNINTATHQELQAITHIGPARATDIITTRTTRPFTSVTDLTRINGIGPARIRDIQTQGTACVH